MATSTAVPQSQSLSPSANIRADVRPRVIQLTLQDRIEIAENARLVSYRCRYVRPGTVEFPQDVHPGWCDVFDKILSDARGRTVRSIVPVENRFVPVELTTNFLSESGTAKFVGLWYRRGFRDLVLGRRDFSVPRAGFSEPVATVPMSQGETIPDEEFVSEFLRSRKDIKRLLCYEHGEERVTQLQRVLVYGVTVPEATKNLQALGVPITKRALEARVQRLRRLLAKQEMPRARNVLMKEAEKYPEGTRDFLRRVAGRAGRTFQQFAVASKLPVNGVGTVSPVPVPEFQSSQFEPGILAHKHDPVRYLKKNHSQQDT